MLLRFGVANHLSIRDYQELLLTASRRRDAGLTMPVPAVDADVVPVTVLYGANASGKSNLLDAMDEMRRLVVFSHKAHDAADRIRRTPFLLDARSASETTRFECSFTLGIGDDAACRDAAVYDLMVEFTETEIVRERLRRSVQNERRSTHTLYSRETRNGRVKVDFGVHLQGENQVTANLTRPNSLFLSAAAQNNHPQLTAVQRWFATRWHCMSSDGPVSEAKAAELLEGHRHREWLDQLLAQAETGVEGVELTQREPSRNEVTLARKVVGFTADQLDIDAADRQELEDDLIQPSRRELHLLHRSANGVQPLDYGLESRGTLMFLTLVLPALDALSSGSLIIIDELDSSLHPDLAQAFVSLFLRRASNPHGAQIVFSTHDVALLGSGLLAEDEIWMVDKDAAGASALTPLSDFHLRGDVERAYRQGRVGGRPESNRFILDLADSL